MAIESSQLKRHVNGVASSTSEQRDWIDDLKHLFTQCQSFSSECSSVRTQFSKVFQQVRFFPLDSHKMPIIFAYSALVNKEVMANCQAIGFEDCITSPMTLVDFNSVCMKKLTSMCNEVIQTHLGYEVFQSIINFTAGGN